MVHTQREQIWQQRITDWQASGLSGMASCKKQSLTYCQFVYWRMKLTLGVPELNEVASSGFASVTAAPDSGTSDGLRVSLPGGVSITGLRAGNIELLGAVLRQL
ncbi:IS66 family insertion sequence element accessory protein TnpA [Marinobacter sp.]|uniref:IS66 family insertion sequence element accessory protein TnpA n=1 Tax=Marinobacter sp. TaxID=50741 RepID=UPI003A95CC86